MLKCEVIESYTFEDPQKEDWEEQLEKIRTAICLAHPDSSVVVTVFEWKEQDG